MKITQNKILLLISLLLCGTLSLSAQKKAVYEKQKANVNVEKLKTHTGAIEKLRITMDINLEGVKLKGQQMLVFTPQIVSEDGKQTEYLPQIILAGNTRIKVLKRQIKFGNTPDTFNPKNAIYYAKDFRQKGTIKYTTEVNYKEWMKKATLGMSEAVEGCATCIAPCTDQFVSLFVLKGDPYIPSFASTYVAPEVEAVKNRAEKIEAFFNYKVARYELLKDYKGNKAELQRVDRFVRKITDDKDLTVSDFSIVGYASPEGDVAKNLTLSQNRAKTFASYLKVEYQVPNSKMHVTGKGEDWDGLRTAVEKSSIDSKTQVLNIIDRYDDSHNRKYNLERLNGGSTYQFLLKEFYPPLRRNTLTVSFVVKGFSVDEALEAYHKNPNLLSLEEFYRISELFTKGSEDFIKVFQTAVKYFPNSEIARLNTGAALIDAQKFSEAKEMLLKAGNSAEVLCNLGIIAFNEGNVAQARAYFEQAKAKGAEAAATNLAELTKYEESI